MESEVSENNLVTLTCKANAVPLATLTLANPNGVTLTFSRAMVSHEIQTVRCQDTGQYTCTATNILGQVDVTKILLVSCKLALSFRNYFD
jgi:hypothetical protein